MTVPFPAEAIDAEVAKVTSLIETAGRHLEAGTVIDLSALEGRVEALCATLRGAPNGMARKYARALEQIVIGLDGLTLALNEQFEAFSRQSAEATPAQAAGAYRRADS
jgi:hypothetical protein